MGKRNSVEIEEIVREIDRLIGEMMALRNQVVGLAGPSPEPYQSVRQAEYFGMWADREDMKGKSSREWLESQRTQQWRHS